MFLCTLFGDFSFPKLVIISSHISYSGFPPILLFQLFRGGVNQLNINHLGPEQSLFHIVPHCSGPKWLIINGLNVFHRGDRNNGTIVSPTFLGGLSRFLPKHNETMVLSTFLGAHPLWEPIFPTIVYCWSLPRGTISPAWGDTKNPDSPKPGTE